MKDLSAVQCDLLAHAAKRGALKFGEFPLKSKRISPYFFNSSALGDGKGLALVGAACADELCHMEFDVIFGLAYKGIPIATVTATALAEIHDVNREVVYARKEPKDHGEGGLLVGVELKGKKIIIVDDVISAGTAINEAVQLILAQGRGNQIVGVLVLLDRQERGAGTLSAVQEVQTSYGMPVTSVLTLDHLSSFLAIDNPKLFPLLVAHDREYYLAEIQKYRDEYGV